MSEIIRKEHNVSALMYHIVCPAKYRRTVINEEIDKTLREICLGIEARYEIKFLEIGTESDHAHFLVQSAPTYSPEQIVRTIKSITARKIFEACPEVKKMLWGGEFWTRGYYMGTVGEHGGEEVIKRYVRNQGRKIDERQKTHEGKRLELFPYQNKT
ncbi:MAG: IS200/IS605 family transposase [Treponema sp.]|jgi:REP element-mobilizing transposase RayT|nr:IS200/IS605 family transposase [Treponema sp.]